MGMNQAFSDVLVEGARNSLGRVTEVIDAVLDDKSRLEELYGCLFHEDEWARMRAADALEKICREHPEWIEPFIDRMQTDFSDNTQPSIQWHMAQIYQQVPLSSSQKKQAIQWLKKLVSTTRVDWIASANAMETLMYFVGSGDVRPADMRDILRTQQKHHSKSVVRKAQKHLDALGQEA